MKLTLTTAEARELFGQPVVRQNIVPSMRFASVEVLDAAAIKQQNDACERAGYKRGLAVAQTSVTEALHRNQCATQNVKRGTAAHRTLVAERQPLLAVAAEIKRNLENA